MLFSYLAIIAVIVVIEHLTFGKWWRRHELARRTIGHTTLLGVSGLFVPVGLIDIDTLVYIAAATIIAGAITAGFAIHEQENRKANKLAALRQEFEQYEQTISG